MEQARAYTALLLTRPVRARELVLRALAEARELLPPDSLILADLLSALTNSSSAEQNALAAKGLLEETRAVNLRRWRAEPEHTLQPSRECLVLLQRRHAAGTLFEVSLEEYAWFFSVDNAAGHSGGGANLLVSGVSMVATCWPHPLSSSEEALAGFRSALQVLMQVKAQGFTARCAAMNEQLIPPSTYDAYASVLARHALHPKCIALTRATCGAAGMQLVHELAGSGATEVAGMLESGCKLSREGVQAAAAEAARYGIKRCALPACAAAEPHARAFKRCARCRVVVYCCAEHQAADWKRHKRAECAPKPQPPDADAGGASGSA